MTPSSLMVASTPPSFAAAMCMMARWCRRKLSAGAGAKHWLLGCRRALQPYMALMQAKAVCRALFVCNARLLCGLRTSMQPMVLAIDDMQTQH